MPVSTTANQRPAAARPAPLGPNMRGGGRAFGGYLDPVPRRPQLSLKVPGVVWLRRLGLPG